MNDSNPLVSVVIPAFNAGRFLGRALRSVVAQSYENKEIIVVDDGSSDDTREVVKSFGTEVRYVWQEHSGQAAATNRGILESGGELIALLDADDEWLPGRLEKTVFPMVDDESVGLCYCLAMLRYPDGRENPRLPTRVIEKRTGGVYWPQRVCVPAVTVRRVVMDQVGLFDETMPHYNDHDFFLRISEMYRIHEVPEFLVRVYHRPGSQQFSYPAAVVVEMYLRVFFKALGRAPAEYDRDVTLSVAYAGAAVRFWRAGFGVLGLKYAIVSCLLKPNMKEIVRLAMGFVPRPLARLAGEIRSGLRRNLG